MSHFSVYKTALKNVSAGFLKQAITSLARQLRAEVVQSVRDNYGRMHDVTIGLKLQSLPNGIGFGVAEDGTLTVHGDRWYSEHGRLESLAKNYIKAFKVAQNALALNPTAKIQTKVLEKEVILEVAV